MRDTITTRLEKAPSSPINLRFGVIYAPRIPTPPFVAFRAIEMGPEAFNIHAYDPDGACTAIFCGSLAETWQRLALHLRMDVDDPTPKESV